MTLRTDLLKLASKKPSLRASILPLLRKTSAYLEDLSYYRNRAKVLTGRNIRILKASQSIVIEELPVKGKKKLRRIIYHVIPYIQIMQNRSSDILLAINIYENARISENMTYDAASKALEKGAKEAVAQFMKEEPEISSGTVDSFLAQFLTEKEVPSLQVAPGDSRQIEFEGVDFKGQSNWNEFIIYPQGDSFIKRYPAKTPTAARKFYTLISEKPNLFQRMDMETCLKWLQKNKISTDSYY